MFLIKIVLQSLLIVVGYPKKQPYWVFLALPCAVHTERPETQTIGTNTLVGTSFSDLEKLFSEFLTKGPKSAGIPELWDGNASSV